MKNIINETKIIKWIVLLPIIGVILTSFILTNLFISSKQESHELEVINLEKKHIKDLKNTIKERIEYISLLLNNNYENQIKKSKDSAKDVLNIGYTILEDLYKNYKHLPKKDLYKLINQRMEKLRFSKNKNGYYFINSLEDGKAISFPSNPTLIGKDIRELKDITGTSIFQDFKKIIDTNGEGFTQWYWNKPGGTKQLKKMGYIKKFEPLNIYIGTAVYIDDIKEELAEQTKEFVKTLRYQDNSYIFIMDTKGTSLVHKNTTIVDVPLRKLANKTQKNVRLILKESLNTTTGTFIEYTQSSSIFKYEKQSKKISYVKHVPVLDWIIGTGLYTNNLDTQINEKYDLLQTKLEENIKTIILISSLVSIVIILFLVILAKRIKRLFQFYAQKLEDNNLKLTQLNNELEIKVQKQVTDIRKKDVILNQQSRLAAMGEMLGNIAHQWRQPLSAISTLASGIRVQKEMNLIDDKQLDKDLEGIVNSTIMLSNTIDDFRNFYSQDKEKKEFGIDNTIGQVLSLISANIKNKDIELIINTKNIKLCSYENELIQSILNILNNAKDALLEIDGQKLIFIEAFKKEDYLVLEIYDNAKGISNKIINRIFEPYFTTKFKSQGTGIGLYMTKNIIESSLDGEIKASNKVFLYKDKEYKGALFIIKIPLR
jgi:signal transduction histidine kinase